MREILFRGKRADNYQWVYGYYCRNVFLSHMIQEVSGDRVTTYQVLPKTVGQFTGLIDRHGDKIFEGDICAYSRFANWEKYNSDGSDARMIGIVTFGLRSEYSNGGDHHAGAFYLRLKDKSKYPDSPYHPAQHIHLNQTNSTWGLEIIGTIHDTINKEKEDK